VIAAHLSGAAVVKTYRSIFWKHLRGDGRPHGGLNRRALPLAGDAPDAKEAATNLLTDIVFDAVDAANSKRPTLPSRYASIRPVVLRRRVAGALNGTF